MIHMWWFAWHPVRALDNDGKYRWRWLTKVWLSGPLEGDGPYRYETKERHWASEYYDI